jgi:hypothetical protein
LHLYAHCLRNHPGGVALLAVNAGRDASPPLDLPTPSERYVLTAEDPMDSHVLLNGGKLQLGAGDALPELKPIPAHAGQVVFAPVSITFLALPNVHNESCH